MIREHASEASAPGGATLAAAPAVEADRADRALGRLAGVAVVAHAAFLSISVAGMQIALAVALGALVLLRLRGQRVWARSPVDAPVLLLAGGAVLSIVIAALAGAPPVGWREATLWRSFLSAPLVLSALAAAERAAPGEGGGRRWALLALTAWALAALVPSALAWVQYWTGFDPLHALGLRKIAVQAKAPHYPGRFAAVGFFKWYQRLAHDLTPPLCVAAAVALQGGLRPRLRALLAVAAAAAAAAVVLTLSRAAWVSIALAVLVLGFLAAGRARRLALPVTIAVTLVMAADPAVRARIVRLSQGADNADRMEIWSVCRAMVRDRPLTGFGFGNLPARSLPYIERMTPWAGTRAWCHDSFFSFWAEGGPLLCGALVGFWVLLARAFWRQRREGDRLGRAAACGAIAALATTFANSLFHDLFYSSEATYALGFTLAMAVALAGGAAARWPTPAPAPSAGASGPP